MSISLGMLRRARERYNKMSPEKKAKEDAYWKKLNEIDKWLTRAFISIPILIGLALIVKWSLIDQICVGSMCHSYIGWWMLQIYH